MRRIHHSLATQSMTDDLIFWFLLGFFSIGNIFKRGLLNQSSDLYILIKLNVTAVFIIFNKVS